MSSSSSSFAIVCTELSFSWPDGTPVFDRLDVAFGPGRTGLIGANGSGKSTLLRLIAGELTPRRGEVRVGVDRVALLDQHAAALAPEQSVLENVMRLNPGVGEGEARGALARFLFRGHEAERRVGALSGGERLRATLGCVMGGSSPPRLLMLDEPGNHLDLESLRELEGALREFGGTMIVVSHDEAFLEAVGVQERVALGASAEGAERGRRAWERVEKRRIG